MSDIDWRLIMMVEDSEFCLFEKMQRDDYDRTSGERALLNNGETDLAEKWTNWWDEGDE